MKLFASSGQDFDVKRFRMRRTLIKPQHLRSETEIEEATEVLQVLSN